MFTAADRGKGGAVSWGLAETNSKEYDDEAAKGSTKRINNALKTRMGTEGAYRLLLFLCIRDGNEKS